MMIENDASQVAKIPLSRKSKPDKMIRKDSITSVFPPIKVVYYVARKVLGKEEVEREQRDKVWRKRWTTKVASKSTLCGD